MLSTVHRAKGLEWDTVYVLQPDDLPFGSGKESSAAKRLCRGRQEYNQYVTADTRALREARVPAPSPSEPRRPLERRDRRPVRCTATGGGGAPEQGPAPESGPEVMHKWRRHCERANGAADAPPPPPEPAQNDAQDDFSYLQRAKTCLRQRVREATVGDDSTGPRGCSPCANATKAANGCPREEAKTAVRRGDFCPKEEGGPPMPFDRTPPRRRVNATVRTPGPRPCPRRLSRPPQRPPRLLLGDAYLTISTTGSSSEMRSPCGRLTMNGNSSTMSFSPGSTCVEIKFRTPNAIDATSSP